MPSENSGVQLLAMLLPALATVCAAPSGVPADESVNHSAPTSADEWSLSAGTKRMPATEGQHRATIFLNFGGALLTGGSDASRDQAACVDGELEYPRFGGTEEEALEVVALVSEAVEPFGIRVAYLERPPAYLPYSMVMIGGYPTDFGISAAAASLSCTTDCTDRWWRDTALVFDGSTVQVAASTVFELGRFSGLEPTATPGDFMYPVAGGDQWLDECAPYSDSTAYCPMAHDVFCDGGAQNSYAEFLEYFGENSPDTTPPSVEITEPMNGARFEPGEPFSVDVEVSDDFNGFGWQIVIEELDEQVPAVDHETSWDLALPEGEYTIRVDAIDHDRNENSDTIRIVVGPPQAGEEEETDAGTGTSTGETPDPPSEATSSGSDTDGETGDEGAPLGGPEGGCAVSNDDPRGRGFALLGLFFVALRRRRR